MTAAVQHKAECNRCVKKTKATEARCFALDDQYYVLELCDTHARAYDREMSSWARLATLTDKPEVSRPLTNRAFSEGQRGARIASAAADARHLHAVSTFAKASVRGMDFSPEVEAKREADALELAYKSIPKAKLWRFTNHALERMRERHFTAHDVLSAAAQPGHVWGVERGPTNTNSLAAHQRGRCVAIVDPVEFAILSVKDKSQMMSAAEALTQKGVNA